MFYEEDVTIDTSGDEIVFNRGTTYSPATPDNSGHFEKDFTTSFFDNNDFYYVFSQNKIWFKINGAVVLQTPITYVNNCYYKIVSDNTVGWKIIFYDDYQARNGRTTDLHY